MTDAGEAVLTSAAPRFADQTILVNLTGSTRENGTPGPIDAWWEREGDQWVPAREPASAGAA